MEGLPRRRQVREPFAGAERYPADAGGMLPKLQLEVTARLSHRAGWFGERHGRGAEHRPPVALTERGELLELLDRVEREAGQRRLAVDRDLGPPQALREAGIDLGHKGSAEVVDLRVGDLQAGRCGMATAAEQVVCAGLEGR